MNREEKERSIKENLEAAQKASAQSIEKGRDIINHIARQDEMLRDAEDSLEGTEYVIDRTMKVLRGMTWGGMVYNWFSTEPKLNDCVGKQDTDLMIGNMNTASSSDSTSSKSTKSSSALTVSAKEGDEDLEHISRNVEQLLAMSTAMGEQIGQQNKTIDRIDEKTARVHDKTLGASLRASQLTRGSGKNAECIFLGTYQFVEAGTAKYLSVVHENVTLLTNPDRSSAFHCFLKSNTLVGMQNAKTLKFLGVTFFGNICVSSNYFGRYEECHVDMDGRPTSIFLLTPNYGSGGWLKKPTFPEGFSEENYDEYMLAHPLNAFTSNILDKTDALIVHAIQIGKGDLKD